MSRTQQVPPWLGNLGADSERDKYAAMSPSERLACFVDVCELTRVILESRPDRREILMSSEPMPPRAERIWRALVDRARRVRSSR
jgi:hypothetical protein